MFFDRYKGKKIRMTDFSDVVNDCEVLEFSELIGDSYELKVAVTQKDEDRNTLYVSTDGDVEVLFLEWVIAWARKKLNLSEGRSSELPD